MAPGAGKHPVPDETVGRGRARVSLVAPRPRPQVPSTTARRDWTAGHDDSTYTGVETEGRETSRIREAETGEERRPTTPSPARRGPVDARNVTCSPPAST